MSKNMIPVYLLSLLVLPFLCLLTGCKEGKDQQIKRLHLNEILMPIRMIFNYQTLHIFESSSPTIFNRDMVLIFF